MQAGIQLVQTAGLIKIEVNCFCQMHAKHGIKKQSCNAFCVDVPLGKSYSSLLNSLSLTTIYGYYYSKVSEIGLEQVKAAFHIQNLPPELR